jgi:hypothetical protein
MINKLLEERVLQPIESFDASNWDTIRNEYIDILCKEEYGMPLPAPTKLEFEVVQTNPRFAAVTAIHKSIIAHTEVLGTEF